MADATILLGLLLTVGISMSVLQAFQSEKIVSELGDRRLRDMENRFKDLLAKTKSEMDDKYISLLNEHVALTKRLEKIEIDNMDLKDKLVNLELEYRLLKLQNDSSRACTKTCKSEVGDIEKPFFNVENDEDLSDKRITDSDTKRQVPKTNSRHMDSPEKRLLLPVTSAPSSVPVPTQTHVAFYARLSQHLKNVGDDQHIEFRDVVTNVGNAYLKATSTFVCPVAGTYVFSWTIASFPDKWIETKLVLNGNFVGLTYSYNDHHLNSGSNTVVLVLQEHDTVWVQVNGIAHHDGTVAYAPFCTFSGFSLW